MNKKIMTMITGVAVLAGGFLIGSAVLKSSGYTGPVPGFKISLNRSAEPEVFKGDPLVAEISIVHPASLNEKNTKPVILESKGGWTSAIHLKVEDEKGEEVRVAWQQAAMAKPGDKLVLTSEMAAMSVWLVSPKDMEKLKAGKYQVFASLLYKGKPFVTGNPVEFKVAENAPETGNQENSLISRSLYYLFNEQNSQALEQVDKLLQDDSGRWDVWEFKGDLLMEAGRDEEALSAYEQAIRNFYGENVPRALMEKYDEVWEKVAYAELEKNPNPKLKKRPRPAPVSQEAGIQESQNLSVARGGAQQLSETSVSESPEPIQGDLKIELSWKEPVDVDLKVEDDGGHRQKLSKEADKGPGQEAFLLKAEDQNGGKYYAAASLIGAAGSRADVTMTVSAFGKPASELKAGLVYDGTHQFWVAFVIDTSKGEIKAVNAFDSSIQKYRKKE